MEDDAVAPVVLARDERHAAPRGAAVGGLVQSAEVVVGCHFAVADATDEHVVLVEGIHRDRTDSTGYSLRVRRRPHLPGLAAVDRSIHAVTRIRIRGEVGFTGAAIQRSRVGQIDCQRTDLQGRVRAPGLLPCGTPVLTHPHAAARSTNPDLVGVHRVAHEGRASAPDVYRTDHLPSGCERCRREPSPRSATFAYQRLGVCVSHRPRGTGPKPAGPRLVMRRHSLRVFAALLARSDGHFHWCGLP